jgi:hypothetical protein
MIDPVAPEGEAANETWKCRCDPIAAVHGRAAHRLQRVARNLIAIASDSRLIAVRAAHPFFFAHDPIS